MTPWTFDLIQQLLKSSPDPLFLRKVTRVFNLMLAGKGGDATLWTTSRIIGLGKPDGGVRPIAVGEVWLRLLGRIVAKKKAHVGQDLAPLQYGVGFKGGAEVIIHACGMFAKWVRARADGFSAADEDPDDPLCMVAVDLTNAFNSIRRGTRLSTIVSLNCWKPQNSRSVKSSFEACP